MAEGHRKDIVSCPSPVSAAVGPHGPPWLQAARLAPPKCVRCGGAGPLTQAGLVVTATDPGTEDAGPERASSPTEPLIAGQ